MPRKLDYPSLIQESGSELLALENSHTKSYLRDRVRFLRFLKDGQVSSQSSAGKLIGLGERQSKNLWSKYKQEGIAYFILPRVNQNWWKLSSVQISKLLQELDKNQCLSQKEA